MKALQRYQGMVPVDQRMGPLFAAGQFFPLSRTHVTNTLCCLLNQADYDSQLYSSHSFLIGAATTSAAAAAAGPPPWLIKTLGRWNSDAYMTYIHCPNHVLREVPALLARTNASQQQAWNPDEQ